MHGISKNSKYYKKKTSTANELLQYFFLFRYNMVVILTFQNGQIHLNYAIRRTPENIFKKKKLGVNLHNKSSDGYNPAAVRDILKRVLGRDGPTRHRVFLAH